MDAECLLQQLFFCSWDRESRVVSLPTQFQSLNIRLLRIVRSWHGVDDCSLDSWTDTMWNSCLANFTKENDTRSAPGRLFRKYAKQHMIILAIHMSLYSSFNGRRVSLSRADLKCIFECNTYKFQSRFRKTVDWTNCRWKVHLRHSIIADVMSCSCLPFWVTSPLPSTIVNNAMTSDSNSWLNRRLCILD